MDQDESEKLLGAGVLEEPPHVWNRTRFSQERAEGKTHILVGEGKATTGKLPGGFF